MQPIDAPKTSGGTMNDDDEDPLACARGVIFAVISGAVLWALVLAWLWFA